MARDAGTAGLLKDRQPYPIEVKARWDADGPPPGLKAFVRKYTATRRTFTVSAVARDDLAEGHTTHHTLSFEKVADILALVD
jgi:hypothetical protein